MAQELATVDSKPMGFTPTAENIELLKTTLASNKTILTDNELGLFLYQANRTGLDPLARQLYVMKTGDKLMFMTSIDGQRLVAQRTGEYQGQVGPQWCGKDGQWRDVWLEDEPPAAAKVGVYRNGFKEATFGIATWKSYAKWVDEWVNNRKTGAKKLSPTWEQLSDVMLAKCAEAIALRKAFPQELSNLYTPEEMDQTKPEVVHAEVVEPKSNLATPPQVAKIFALLKDKGVTTGDEAKQTVYAMTGVTSMKELTKEQASTVMAELETSEKLGAPNE